MLDRQVSPALAVIRRKNGLAKLASFRSLAAGLVLSLLIIGSVTAYVLVGKSAEIRQQASGGIKCGGFANPDTLHCNTNNHDCQEYRCDGTSGAFIPTNNFGVCSQQPACGGTSVNQQSQASQQTAGQASTGKCEDNSKSAQGCRGGKKPGDLCGGSSDYRCQESSSSPSLNKKGSAIWCACIFVGVAKAPNAATSSKEQCTVEGLTKECTTNCCKGGKCVNVTQSKVCLDAKQPVPSQPVSGSAPAVIPSSKPCNQYSGSNCPTSRATDKCKVMVESGTARCVADSVNVAGANCISGLTKCDGNDGTTKNRKKCVNGNWQNDTICGVEQYCYMEAGKAQCLSKTFGYRISGTKCIACSSSDSDSLLEKCIYNSQGSCLNAIGFGWRISGANCTACKATDSEKILQDNCIYNTEAICKAAAVSAQSVPAITIYECCYANGEKYPNKEVNSQEQCGSLTPVIKGKPCSNSGTSSSTTAPITVTPVTTQPKASDKPAVAACGAEGQDPCTERVAGELKPYCNTGYVIGIDNKCRRTISCPSNWSETPPSGCSTYQTKYASGKICYSQCYCYEFAKDAKSCVVSEIKTMGVNGQCPLGSMVDKSSCETSLANSRSTIGQLLNKNKFVDGKCIGCSAFDLLIPARCMSVDACNQKINQANQLISQKQREEEQAYQNFITSGSPLTTCHPMDGVLINSTTGKVATYKDSLAIGNTYIGTDGVSCYKVTGIKPGSANLECTYQDITKEAECSNKVLSGYVKSCHLVDGALYDPDSSLKINIDDELSVSDKVYLDNNLTACYKITGLKANSSRVIACLYQQIDDNSPECKKAKNKYQTVLTSKECGTKGKKPCVATFQIDNAAVAPAISEKCNVGLVKDSASGLCEEASVVKPSTPVAKSKLVDGICKPCLNTGDQTGCIPTAECEKAAGQIRNSGEITFCPGNMLVAKDNIFCICPSRVRKIEQARMTNEVLDCQSYDEAAANCPNSTEMIDIPSLRNDKKIWQGKCACLNNKTKYLQLGENASACCNQAGDPACKDKAGNESCPANLALKSGLCQKRALVENIVNTVIQSKPAQNIIYAITRLRDNCPNDAGTDGHLPCNRTVKGDGNTTVTDEVCFGSLKKGPNGFCRKEQCSDYKIGTTCPNTNGCIWDGGTTSCKDKPVTNPETEVVIPEKEVSGQEKQPSSTCIPNVWRVAKVIWNGDGSVQGGETVKSDAPLEIGTFYRGLTPDNHMENICYQVTGYQEKTNSTGSIHECIFVPSACPSGKY